MKDISIILISCTCVKIKHTFTRVAHKKIDRIFEHVL